MIGPLRTVVRLDAYKTGAYPYNNTNPTDRPERVRVRLANLAAQASKLAGMPAKRFDAAFVDPKAREVALARVEDAQADLDALRQRLIKAGDK